MSDAAMAAAADQKELCWVRVGKVKKKPSLSDPLQLFSLAEVVKTEGTGEAAIATVKVVRKYYDEPFDPAFILPQGGGLEVGETAELSRSELLLANNSRQDLCMDLSDLDNLNEAALLHTIGMRYCGGDKAAEGVESFYSTFIGAICVAVNPFAPQRAWVNTFKLAGYLSSKPDVISNKKLQPHSWTVGDLAYQELLHEGKDQAILICGESGAGKTECCKFVLEFLINKKKSQVERLSEKLMDTNDPLEAFGNAKTVNNDNSSRFAKCMQIAIGASGEVLGAEIQTSLLEKARTCAFFQQVRPLPPAASSCDGGCDAPPVTCSCAALSG